MNEVGAREANWVQIGKNAVHKRGPDHGEDGSHKELGDDGVVEGLPIVERVALREAEGVVEAGGGKSEEDGGEEPLWAGPRGRLAGKREKSRERDVQERRRGRRVHR